MTQLRVRGQAATALAVLRLLFRERFALDFSVRLWDGTHVRARNDARFTFEVRTPFALRAAFTPPIDLNPARAFIENWIDLPGDAEAAVDELERALSGLPKVSLPILAARLLQLPSPPRHGEGSTPRRPGIAQSRARDVATVRFHYDQPVDFYAAFLDTHLVYSCAYYERDDLTLEQAQEAKIDYTLRKLRLRSGERLLDIGCGWGALVIRAAERFGAHALGITLSAVQRDEAQRRILARSLGTRASVEVRDYRDLGALRFDKIVSIGMVEHVGRRMQPAYFESAFKALRPGGLFLNHGIAYQVPGRATYRASGFIDRHVFPDSELLPVSDSLILAERAGFEVRDVENLREHYTRTLRAWVANLERNAQAAIAAGGERAYRVWRLYMAGSAQGFRSGRMGVFQALLAKPHADGSADVAPTRRELCAG